MRSGTTWLQQDNVIAPFGDDDDHFGCSIGISSAYMVVGADKTDKPGEDSSGSAHVFFAMTVWNCIVGVSGANALRGKIYFLNLE